MAYWLVKTEPDVYSIDDLEKDRVTCWDHVRNYQARNNLQKMQRGDQILVYHSNAEPSAVAGLAAVAKTSYPDASQFDKRSEYFDPKATPENPRWFSPDLRFVKKFPTPVPLQKIKSHPGLKSMLLVNGGARLSVQPVTESEFKIVLTLALEK